MTAGPEDSGPALPAVVVDVGARWGAHEMWRSLAPRVRVYGFDPDEAECERLNNQARGDGDEVTTYVPVALGAKPEFVDLYVTRQPACSSIYQPMEELIQRFPVLADIGVEHTTRIELVRLDDWCQENQVEYIDVLKLDTQGSELGVLRGATRMLSTVTLVQCEVEFNPIYRDQPLFSDVDAFLRAHGFALWRFENLMHYSDDDLIAKLEGSVTAFANSRASRARFGGGQLYWADAIWVREALISADAPADADRLAPIMRAAGLTDLATILMPSLAPELLAEARARRRLRRRSATIAELPESSTRHSVRQPTPETTAGPKTSGLGRLNKRLWRRFARARR